MQILSEMKKKAKKTKLKSKLVQQFKKYCNLKTFAELKTKFPDHTADDMLEEYCTKPATEWEQLYMV